MSTYEAPTLTEVGSVREMTQQQQVAIAFDGSLFMTNYGS